MQATEFSFKEIAKENDVLVRNLAKYSPESAVPMLAALLTLPQYQSMCIRLEVLVTLAAIYCKGRKVTHTIDLCRWLHMIQQSKIVHIEDPAEDVFVHLVRFEGEGFRLIGGIWESAGFYLQRVLDVVETMPIRAPFSDWKKAIKALLTVSDLVCERSGLGRYEAASETVANSISVADLPGREELVSRTTISQKDLEVTGIDLDLLGSFKFDVQNQQTLAGQLVEQNNLLWKPMLSWREGQICISMPSSIVLAIREFVVSQCQENGLVQCFDQKVRQSYMRLLSLIEFEFLLNVEHVPLNQTKAQDHFLPHAVKVDQGHYVVLIFVFPSVRSYQVGHFCDPVMWEEETEQSVLDAIRDVTIEVSSIPDFQRGLVMYIDCGWGQKSVALLPKKIEPRWQLLDCSAADFHTLGFARDMSLTNLWKLLDGLEIAEAQGVKIINPSGLLNVVGWVQSHGGCVLPPEQLPDVEISVSETLHLLIPPDKLREVRRLAVQGHDTHFVRDNAGKNHTIRRIAPYPEHDEPNVVPIYYSLSDLIGRQTRTSVYVGTFQIWTTLTTTGTTNHEIEGGLIYTINTWLERVGRTLDEIHAKSFVEGHICRVDVEFEDPAMQTDTEATPSIEELARYCRVKYSKLGNSAKIFFEAGFMVGFGVDENIAERLIVRQLTQASLCLLNLPITNSAFIEGAVVQNTDARSLHRVHGRAGIDLFIANLPISRIEFTSVEKSSVELGLGWRARDKSQGREIVGKTQCKEFLKRVVQYLGEDIVRDLHQFERHATIKKLILNIEKADLDRSHIDRSSASTLGLYGESNQVLKSVQNELSTIGTVIVTSRILIEMAICECPVGSGRIPADMELSRQMARVRSLVLYGGQSDAINLNILEPRIQISPVGQILNSLEFEELVVEPTIRQLQTDNFLKTVPRQREHYDKPDEVTDANQHFDPTFVKIWTQDFGFDIEECRKILATLENLGLEQGAVIFYISKETYLSELKNEGISNQVAEAFLKQFSMEPRGEWFAPPEGFQNNDIKPWKFGRRYSYLTRPILQMSRSCSVGSQFMICPPAVRSALKYVLDQAMCGRLDRDFFPHPDRWDHWLDRAREGHSFTSKVAAKLSEIGWDVRTNVKLTTVLRKQLDKDYGDIDVLAWRCDSSNDVLVVECKDLAVARNLSEIANILSQYQGQIVNGKRDKLRKHLDRFERLVDNSSAVAKFTQLDEVSLKSCLIFSKTSPVYYATIPALEATFVGTLDDLVQKYG